MADLTEFPLVIDLGEEYFVNPVGKVFKRFENGEVDDLSYFYRVFAERPKSPRAAPSPRPRG